MVYKMVHLKFDHWSSFAGVSYDHQSQNCAFLGAEVPQKILGEEPKR